MLYKKDALIYDFEVGTSWLTWNDEKFRDNTPHNPNNMLVTAHYCHLTDLTDLEQCYDQLINNVRTDILHHNEMDPDHKPDLSYFGELYGKVDVVVAHNNKFDEMWARAVGLPLPNARFCTMICQYLLNKGQKSSLRLEDVVKAYNLTEKKSDLTHEEFQKGKEYYEIALDKVIEYGEGDVRSTGELFIKLMQELEDPINSTLKSIVVGTNEMTDAIIDMEMNGIQIDMKALKEVEQSYQSESQQLERDIQRMIREVMGDRPYNMNSGEAASNVMYSRTFKSKARKTSWKNVMNLGKDEVTGKEKYRPRFSNARFANEVKDHFDILQQEVATHCHTCDGRGMIRKLKKDGTPWKNLSPCPECDKQGVLYQKTGKVAGFKLAPFSARDASVHGFKTDKATLELLIKQAKKTNKLEAAVFLEKIIRKNAVDVYLRTFIKGLNLFTRSTGLIHPSFNQTTTATGRLSSSNPNWQNMPKGNKFPVRKAVISRFEGGEIWEADYSQLEFRGAGELSGDPVIIQQVKDGFDVHRQTAAIINKCKPEEVTKEQRGQAKATTFAPLYGGRGAFEAEHIKAYYDAYFTIYKRLGEWHSEMFTQAIETGIIQTPTGRQFKFDNVTRTAGGRVTNATNICNYPVQSFSTADCVPRACVNVLRMFREQKLLSKLIITVHDSIVCDVHPDEKKQVLEILKEGMMGVSKDAETLWNFKMQLPLDIEVATGKNWMDIQEIPLDQVPS
jgi:DNA polymerase I-like protein with 3'-5' exonuclease and polymerase domains